MTNWIKSNWPGWLSGIVIFLALGVFIGNKTETAAQIGDFFAGFSAALAFIWLIAGFMQQRKELVLQRQELALQREALEQQREELNRIGKYAALDQISKILKEFEDSLPKKNIQGITKIEDLNQIFMPEFAKAVKILEPSAHIDISKTYLEWAKIEGVCKEFLSAIMSVVILHNESSEEADLKFLEGEDDAEYIYFNYDSIKNIRPLRNYIGSAHFLATQITLCTPGLKKMELANIETIEKIDPKVINREGVDKLRAEIAEIDRIKKKSE